MANVGRSLGLRVLRPRRSSCILLEQLTYLPVANESLTQKNSKSYVLLDSNIIFATFFATLQMISFLETDQYITNSLIFCVDKHVAPDGNITLQY